MSEALPIPEIPPVVAPSVSTDKTTTYLTYALFGLLAIYIIASVYKMMKKDA